MFRDFRGFRVLALHGNLGRVRVFHVRVFDLVRSRNPGNLEQILFLASYFTHIKLRLGLLMFLVHVSER